MEIIIVLISMAIYIGICKAICSFLEIEQFRYKALVYSIVSVLYPHVLRAILY